MDRIAVIAFLLAHGIVHVGVWAMPKAAAEKPAPFDPAHSWALTAARVDSTSMRSASVTLASLAAVLFGAAAFALAIDAAMWAGLAAAGALLGLTLKALWFNPWLSLGVALDLGVLVAVSWS
jgi:hypothetical protein